MAGMERSTKAIAIPLAVTIKRVNEITRGWINYFRIGMMQQFMEELGEWLRHKIRVIVMKQWKTPKTIYRNLCYLNRKNNNGFNRKAPTQRSAGNRINVSGIFLLPFHVTFDIGRKSVCEKNKKKLAPLFFLVYSVSRLC